ncbi:hypothetical protein [Halorubrum vacuolatum]|uniref:Uncharacterized protein n=1 Tax=Halorubrum vacuolatum TaxID=63740 RepID=A0A238UQ89_HALVU|nr:hypothetical protein [Halorubrum vacuolatum]SNR23817.1 hypothetical protein SAMN06264855_101174 [Halorubrum vacuolatum]
MNRRGVMTAVGALAITALAGCADDEADDPDEEDPEDLEELLEESAESDSDPENDGSAVERNPPEEAVAEFLDADAEGDGERANELFYDEDPFPAEMDPIPEPELRTVAEWNSVEAIMESGGLPESEAEDLVAELETEREEVTGADPDVDDLTYVFAVMQSAEADEIYQLLTVVEVDGEWLVSSFEQILPA